MFIPALTFLSSVFQMEACFNIESSSWKYLKDPAEGFGYRVIQHDASRYSRNSRGIQKTPIVMTDRLKYVGLIQDYKHNS